MATYTIIERNLYPYYKEIIDFEREKRNEIDNQDTLSAINMNIILCSACYLEGILEERGNFLLGYNNAIRETIHLDEFEQRKAFNTIQNRVRTHFKEKLSHTTGLDNFDSLFQLFLGVSFKQSNEIKPLVEGINVLFQLRNVIAHGRKAFAYELEAYYTSGAEEYFTGGYKKAEEYLIKKELLKDKFFNADAIDVFFTNSIADHFYDLVITFISLLDEFIKDNLIIGDAIIENLNKYNERAGTELDVYQYFQMSGITP